MNIDFGFQVLCEDAQIERSRLRRRIDTPMADYVNSPEGQEPVHVLAIDPGDYQSGYAEWSDGKIISFGKEDNKSILKMVASSDATDLVIEKVASYGMPVGASVFDTVFWAGRFYQMWKTWRRGRPVENMVRKDVKMHICGNPGAKDANIRQALIDRLGQPGTKRAPGATYGIKADAWQALALAITYADKRDRRVQ